MQNDPARRINRPAEGNNLHGACGSLKKLVPNSTVEPYLLWQTTPSVLDELGLRGISTGTPEACGSRRRASGRSTTTPPLSGSGAVWGAYAELGYTFRASWAPRLYAEHTFGSGASDPADGVAGGFVDLFPTAHLWYGYNDMVGWRNLKNIRIGSQFKPTGNVSVRLDYHSFWLADKADGLYNVAGRRSVAAPVGGATDAKVGDEVDATFAVHLTRTMTVGGGIGYMFAGPFLDANSPGSGNTFTFLFFGNKF